ncbi:MAG: LamG-like jellyroll fold domain-containing protein [Dysgonomonas sp.]
MKKFTPFLIAFLLCSIVSVYSQQLAFPGAEGFGRFAIGGRNGEVYHVSNLNDTGTGSLRDAVSKPNRIVVFDVSGVIKIKSRMVFSSNLTIAGQTAPGEGITVYGNGVSFSGAHNVICRYIRFRMGRSGDSGKDAAGISNGTNMIFDHVSVSWGRDENFSISWDNKGTEPSNITIQNSIISQGLQTHSCGGLIQTNGGVTLFRNLYIDNKTRNPKSKGLTQFVNNVIYNWGGGGAYILGGDSQGTSWGTIVNNYFISGPSSGSTPPYTRANSNFQLYATGNYYDSNLDGSLNGAESQKADYGSALWVESPDYWNTSTPTIPQMHPEIQSQMSSLDAYNWIVDKVGASLPVRDNVDGYVIDELTSLGAKGALISNESELNLEGGNAGYIFNAPKLTDTDGDGIPDVWEDILGTDKNVNDAMTIGVDGYTNIERYINSIDKPIDYLKYPVDVKVSGNNKTSLTFTWKNFETKATSIIAEISTDNITFTEAAVFSGNATTGTVDNLEKETLYYIRLKAVNNEIQSEYSATISVKTETDPTLPRTSVNPQPSDSEELNYWKYITLSWENLTNPLGGTLKYNLFLGKSTDNLTSIASELTETSYFINELDEETTYYWRVDATNDLGTTTGDVWNFKTGKQTDREAVLYLPFDEGNGNTASDPDNEHVASAVNFTPEWAEGKVGHALRFANQNNTYMSVPHSESIMLDNTSFTISLWFKSAGVGSNNDTYLINKGSFSKDTNTGATGKWYGIQYKNSKLTFAIDDDVTKTNIDFAAAAYFDNSWHHIACVRDRENKMIRMYLDGEMKLEKADAKTGAIGEESDLMIGNSRFLNNPYQGEMDELRIYNSALRADEIYDLFNITPNSITSEQQNKDTFYIYPNPFTDNFNVTNESNESFTLTVTDLSGRTILSKEYKDGNITVTAPSNMISGIYICSIISNGTNIIRKIAKK